MLEVSSLSYTYKGNKKPALNNLSFNLEEGKMNVLLGCNGAGKSTLIRILAGLLKPEQGSVLLDSKDIFSLSSKERARSVAYVPQNPENNELTVYENVLLGRIPYLQSRPSESDLKKTEEVLKEMNLEELSSRPLSSLSGGERQRVTIARALCQEAKLLLLDEPNSSLDIRSQLDLFSLLKRLIREKNIITVVSLHSLSQALQFGDYFLLLKKGTLLAQGDDDIITEDNLQKLYYVETKIISFQGQKVIVYQKERNKNSNEKESGSD